MQKTQKQIGAKTMAITVREKEHWKERIIRKIDQAIEAICAAENPNFMEKIRKQANDRALESLGIADLANELRSLDTHKETLDIERRNILKQVLANIQGEDIESISRHVHSLDDYEIKAAVNRRVALMETELLAENEIGKRILNLRKEKEELLDTVWLATSPKQVKQLWQTVAEVLKQEPTDLQREAMGIEPMDEPGEK
jgi:DNA polymerase III gamma/tau subunit